MPHSPTAIVPARRGHFLDGADTSLALLVDHATFPLATDPRFVSAAGGRA